MKTAVATLFAFLQPVSAAEIEDLLPELMVAWSR